MKEVGTSIQSFNTSIQKVSNKVVTEIENNQEKISQIVQWGNIALEMRDKWKSRKKLRGRSRRSGTKKKVFTR